MQQNTSSQLTPEQLTAYSTQLDSIQKSLKQGTSSTPTLNSGSLAGATPFKVTPTAPATSADGLGGYIASQTDQFTKDLEAKAKQAEADRATARDTYIQGLKGTAGETALTDQAYKTTVDPAEAELKDINNQLIAEQQGLQRRLEALDKNPNGLFGQALQDEKARITRDSVAKQADLSVIQMAKQGKYDSAKAIADRAVMAKLEEEQNKIKALEINYQDNKELFTTAERRVFETQLAERKQKADMEAYKEKSRFDAIIQQNDPKYQAELQKLRNENAMASGMGGGRGNGQYAGVINTILGSGKFTKDQANAIRNAVANGEDPLTVIKNQAKGLLGQTEATTVTKLETAQSAMKELDANLKAFYQAGGKTNIFSGNYEKVYNKLGEVQDPRLVDLAVQIQANLQVYRNAVSGTAYSEQEGKDIASIFPGINKSEGLNTAIINGRYKVFDSTIDGMYRSALGGAYDQLKQGAMDANAPAPITPTVTPEHEAIFDQVAGPPVAGPQAGLSSLWNWLTGK